MNQTTIQPADIAIIGMACLFPSAPNLESYWHNILNKIDAVTDPPSEAWDANLFYNPQDKNRLYCKKGGFLGPWTEFNPFEYGIMPKGLDGGDPDQWLTLKVAMEALKDAHYLERLSEREEERHRAAVVLGKGTYLNRGNLNMLQHSLVIDQTVQILQSLHPEYSSTDMEMVRSHLREQLPAFDSESAPGLVPNIIASRIANRLDLMGPTYTVDAACASSLIAIDIAVHDLVSGRCDLALAGGSHVTTPLPILMLFTHLNALSHQEKIRPFDLQADGTILGEGIGIVVLKRLADAERDGDRIYAVIKGTGTSSDGKAKGVLAPRAEGARLAVERAYAVAGISPETVGYIEAHGTATTAGDLNEITALQPLFPAHPGQPPYCAIGSVKSMIGHTMASAGVAGVIKTALALYHQILPPTLNVETPNPKLPWSETGFYLNTESRPWIHAGKNPRRAGINAFGFGGINAHVILEQYNPTPANQPTADRLLRQWDSELIILEAEQRAGILAAAQELQNYLTSRVNVPLVDLAYTLNSQLQNKPLRLAIVADSLKDLQDKLARAIEQLQKNKNRIKDTNGGVYYFEEKFYPQGKLAFLFPGEGSQYPYMLADLCQNFPEVRACYDRIDQLYAGHARGYLPSDVIFPHPFDRQELGKKLWDIDEAIEAVLTGNQALFALMNQLKIQPDVIAGHSTGEYSAMRAAGMIAQTDIEFFQSLLDVSKRYDQTAVERRVPSFTLVAVGAGREKVEGILSEVGGNLQIGMDNCPHQTVIAGTKAETEAAIAVFRQKGIIYEVLPFDRAYHTPLFAPFEETLHTFFNKLPIVPPQIPTYSGTSAQLFTHDITEIRATAVKHWVATVRFTEMVNQMYADGVRIFVEVGGRGNLNAFIGDILRGKPHLAIPANLQQRSGIKQLHHLLGMLAAQGVAINFAYLYQHRRPQQLTLAPGENIHPQKPGTVKLATDWAMMHLSPEIAQKLVKEQVNAGTPISTNGQAEKPTPPPIPTYQPAITNPQPPAIIHQPSLPPYQPPPMPTHSSPARAQVMQTHLHLMGQFLQTQEAVLQQLIAKTTSSHQSPIPTYQPQPTIYEPPTTHVQPPTTDNQQSASLPFIREIISLNPGYSAEISCILDLDQDTFIQHHTLGHDVSLTDPVLTGLPVVPFTMSMELLAEAASILLPDKTLIGMKEVRGYRWVTVEYGKLALRLIAKRKPGTNEIDVRLHLADGQPGSNIKMPLIEGVMVFGDEYYPAPTPQPLILQNEHPSRWNPSNIYAEGLFHGDDFRAIAAVTRTGDNGLEAILQALPRHHHFHNRQPNYLTDPAILDAAGQVVGLWTMENLSEGFIIFPYRLGEIRFYRPPILYPEQATFRAKVGLTEDGRTYSDIDILDPQGNMWMQLLSWEDKRFFGLTWHFYRFELNPPTNMLSLPWTTVQNQLGNETVCVRLPEFPEGFFEASHGLWGRVLAHLVLTRRERAEWIQMEAPTKRKLDWLLGRAAAKDAVRYFLKQKYGILLCPADIEIDNDEYRRPIVKGEWQKQIGQPIYISITHTERGMAAALAGHKEQIGIDIELETQMVTNVLDSSFASTEQLLIKQQPASEAEKWFLRLWCAKEAVGKAFGRGLAQGPLSFLAEKIDADQGLIWLRASERMGRAFPELQGRLFAVQTWREEGLVVACSIN